MPNTTLSDLAGRLSGTYNGLLPRKIATDVSQSVTSLPVPGAGDASAAVDTTGADSAGVLNNVAAEMGRVGDLIITGK